MAFDFTTRAGRLAFYKSAIWRHFRQAYKDENPWCNRCETVEEMAHLHHDPPLRELKTLEEAMDPNHVEGLCLSCHGKARDW